MPKVGNKVINYSVYVRQGTKVTKVGDTTSVQLPSIEFLTDTIKGAGIVGEIDWPSYYQPGSMTLGISLRVTSAEHAALIAADNIEIRWVTDVFDTTNVSVGITAHKAFIRCKSKKIDEGKLEPAAAQDASFEYEAFAFKRVINGKEVLNIDKFNGIFSVNGTNLLKNVQSAL
jgi:uncharacterized protein